MTAVNCLLHQSLFHASGRSCRRGKTWRPHGFQQSRSKLHDLLRKGSDIGSTDPLTGNLVALFNPREQLWTENFQLAGATILGVTAEGRTTVEFLQLNSPSRLIERQALIIADAYPPKFELRKPK